MIEVIKHSEQVEPKYIMKCYNCKCIFSYNEHDRHGYDCIRKDEYVTCPECGKWNLHKYRTREFKIKNLLLETDYRLTKLRGH